MEFISGWAESIVILILEMDCEEDGETECCAAQSSVSQTAMQLNNYSADVCMKRSRVL